MNMPVFILTLEIIIGLAIFVIFPLYVAVQAGRKNHRNMARVIYFSFIPPLFPFLPPVALVLALFAFFKYELNKPNLDADPTLQMIVGIGTSFCGATGRQSDGSFITTQWIRFFGLPLVPIQSYRVLYEGTTSHFGGTHITASFNYSILERHRINKSHVILNYAFLFVLFMVVLMVFVSDISTTVSLIILGVVVVIGWFLWRAK